MPDPRDRRVVVILGMDRSGTSLCSRILNLLGVDLGTEMVPPNIDNEHGFWESVEILEINNRVLSALGFNWHDSALLQPFPPAWWRSQAVAECRDNALNIVDRHTSGGNLWGFKDPRTATLLPFWIDVFDRLAIQPAWVVAVRDPRAVALSLEQRNKLSRAFGELLWIERSLDIARYVGGAIAAIVHYEDWFVRAAEQARRLVANLALPWPGDAAEMDVALASVIKHEAQHHSGRDDVFHMPTTRWLYDQFRDLSGIRHLHESGIASRLSMLSRDTARVSTEGRPPTGEAPAAAPREQEPASPLAVQEPQQQLVVVPPSVAVVEDDGAN